jgi:hypothetical protein
MNPVPPVSKIVFMVFKISATPTGPVCPAGQKSVNRPVMCNPAEIFSKKHLTEISTML